MPRSLTFWLFSAEVRVGGMVLTVTSLLEVDGCPPVKLREDLCFSDGVSVYLFFFEFE